MDCFLADITGYYSPFLHHVKQYWKQHKDNNADLIFITFEDMKADLASVVKKVAHFLGKPLPNDMNVFLDHLSFKKMKDNTAVNKADFIEV